jgi:hypothetical protein
MSINVRTADPRPTAGPTMTPKKKKVLSTAPKTPESGHDDEFETFTRAYNESLPLINALAKNPIYFENNLRDYTTYTTENGVMSTAFPAHIDMLYKLKELNVVLMPCLRSLPDSIGNLQHLETLTIVGTGVENLPESMFKTLTALKTLEIADNHNLKSIPPLAARDASSLETLVIDNNENLETILDWDNLISLCTLKIRECPKLAHFPTHGAFESLTNVEITQNKALEVVENFADETLKNIRIENNTSLVAVKNVKGDNNCCITIKNNPLLVEIPEEFKGSRYYSYIQYNPLLPIGDYYKHHTIIGNKDEGVVLVDVHRTLIFN